MKQKLYGISLNFNSEKHNHAALRSYELMIVRETKLMIVSLILEFIRRTITND